MFDNMMSGMSDEVSEYPLLLEKIIRRYYELSGQIIPRIVIILDDSRILSGISFYTGDMQETVNEMSSHLGDQVGDNDVVGIFGLGPLDQSYSIAEIVANVPGFDPILIIPKSDERWKEVKDFGRLEAETDEYRWVVFHGRRILIYDNLPDDNDELEGLLDGIEGL